MRSRETSYGINTATKFKILQNNNIVKDESKRKENYEALEEYASSNLYKKEGDSIEPVHNIPFHPLKPEPGKRMYLSKGKPIKFHENASIVKLNQSDLGEINSSQRQVNFLTLMAMFDENELNDINIEQLLGVNMENFGIMKEKLNKIISYVNNAEGDKEEAMAMLKDKSNQINKNIENIKNVEGNVENIDKIIFGENETKVIFQLK